MAYLSVPKISRHLIFLHLSSPFIVDNCSYISILSFAITSIKSIFNDSVIKSKIKMNSRQVKTISKEECSFIY